MRTKRTVRQAIQKGKEIIQRHPSYSMEYRNANNEFGTSFDCSSFIGTIWDVPGCPTTPIMKTEYPKYGFQLYTYGQVQLKVGDILVHDTGNPDKDHIGHTMMIYTMTGTHPVLIMESSG